MANNIPVNAVTVSNNKENIKYVLNKPDTANTTGTRVGDLEKEINDFINITAPTTWKEVQDIVRAGKAPLYFNIGDQFVVNKKILKIDTELQNSSTITATITNYVDLETRYNQELTSGLTYSYFEYESSGWAVYAYSDGSLVKPSSSISDLESYCGIKVTGTPVVGDKIILIDSEELAFDIIGFDHDIPTDTNYKHSMTLQLHDLYAKIPFDSQEATWFIDPTTYPSGLAVGTYQFKYGMDNYIFTTTKVVPASGQLVYSFNTASTKTVTTYNSSSSTDALETCTVTKGTATNKLPDPLNVVYNPDPTYKPDTTVVNYADISMKGSSKYSESVIRQYINASAESDWWTPKNNFDRPPIENQNIPGFLYGMETEFLNVIGNVNKVTYTVPIDNNCKPFLTESSEKFFLPSCGELYAVDTTSDLCDGTPYEYYIVNSANSGPTSSKDACRIKTGSSIMWWTRSANDIGSLKIVDMVGSINPIPSFGTSFSVAPACVII